MTKRADPETRLKIAHDLAKSKDGMCLSEAYQGVDAPMHWRCGKGHEWSAPYYRVVATGSWCPFCAGKKRSLDNQIQKAHEVALSKGGLCLTAEYTKSISPIRWRCAKGHEWQTSFRSVVENGTWCPLCGGTRAIKSDQLRLAQELAASKGGACLSKVYLGSDEPMQWRCQRGHTWHARYYNVVNTAGTWCPICSSGLKERLARNAIETIFDRPFKKYRPKWLRNPKTGSLLELDGFNSELNLAFEYQGEQHYKIISGFFMTEGDLEVNRYRDAIKRSLCEAHDIQILEIPYSVEANCLLEWIAAEISGNQKLKHLVPMMADYQTTRPRQWVESDAYSIAALKNHAKSKNGECLSESYIGAFEKYRWRCSEGHEWEALWANVNNKSSWCAVCSGHLLIEPMKQLHQIAKAKGGQCLSESYLGARTKHLFQCQVGHKWQATPDSIKRGSWCIACLGRIGHDGHMKLISEIAKQKGGECLSSTYLGQTEKHHFRCQKGHEWHAIFSNVKRGSWCPYCAKKKLLPLPTL